MKPYFETDLVTIYHGDCENVLPQLPQRTVDAVITDPPYGIRYRSKRKDKRVPATIRNDESLNALRGILPLLDTLVKQDRHVYVFAAPMKIGEACEALEHYWHLKNVIVWDKGNAGSRGDCQAGYSCNWEAIIYASKGRRPIFGPRPRSIFRFDWQAWHDPVHPTVKPAGLMRWLISKCTAPGELILDPFMGSGVVLRAAAELGRRAIGVELEERYCEVAASRLVRSGTDAGISRATTY
jgi:site-specific DNA-methyltransferase (adenine-specific)